MFVLKNNDLKSLLMENRLKLNIRMFSKINFKAINVLQ